MPGVRSWPSEIQLVEALEAEVPLWAPPLVWPAAWLDVLRGATAQVPCLDRDLISDLERVLRQQTAWMQRVSRVLGGLLAASVTNVIADTVIGWARTAVPCLQERPGCRKSLGTRVWDPHGIYSEVHLPVVAAGKIVGKPCDLVVVMRSGAPDLIVEIDRENNKNFAAKLMIARDAGATSTWIRWAGGRTTAVPGTHLIDLVSETRTLGVTTATPPRLREVERDEVVISEFSEIKISLATGDKEVQGQPSAGQIRYKAAKWLACNMTCREDPGAPQDGRLADGLVVTGHQRIGDLRPDRIPGELVRYEVSYTKMPGSVVSVRPLAVAPLS
jgi:hypothetical protein